MTAIDPKETARYTARLFGYFLAVAIVGGGITAGGAVLLRNENVFSGSVDANAEVIVGGALAGVGILLILAGFFAIVLNVVADGVRFGVEGATGAPEAEPGEARAPVWTPGRQPRAAARTPPARRRPAAGEPDRRRRSEATAGGNGEDETWKREVEEKLADEDRTGRTGRPGEHSMSTAEGADSPDVASPSEGSPERRAGTAHGTETGREATRESGVERDPGGEPPTEPTEAGSGTPAREPTAGGEADRSNSETWVSGDEVSEERAPEQDGASDAGDNDDPLAAGETEEDEPTDPADEDADSPAWLDESGNDEADR